MIPCSLSNMTMVALKSTNRGDASLFLRTQEVSNEKLMRRRPISAVRVLQPARECVICMPLTHASCTLHAAEKWTRYWAAANINAVAARAWLKIAGPVPCTMGVHGIHNFNKNRLDFKQLGLVSLLQQSLIPIAPRHHRPSAGSSYCL